MKSKSMADLWREKTKAEKAVLRAVKRWEKWTRTWASGTDKFLVAYAEDKRLQSAVHRLRAAEKAMK